MQSLGERKLSKMQVEDDRGTSYANLCWGKRGGGREGGREGRRERERDIYIYI